MKRLMWHRSLTIQISTALVILFLLAIATVGYTLYAVELRRHDYLILNLAGQLRVLAGNLEQQGESWREQSRLLPAGTGAPNAPLFLRLVGNEADQFGRIVGALEERQLPPEYTGRDEPIVCSWDSQAIGQLELTASAWSEFRAGLDEVRQGSQQEQARRTATYLQANGPWLVEVSANLATAFQHMMERKLDQITVINRIALASALVIIALLLALLVRTFVMPLRATVAGFTRVAQGDFDHRVPVAGDNEIGQMAGAFNHLSARLAAIFRLTERISQANSLDETLHFVFDEFRDLLPLDWLGLLYVSADGHSFRLDRVYTDSTTELRAGDSFSAEGTLLRKVLEQNRPQHLADLSDVTAEYPESEFARRLQTDGRRSALLFPVTGSNQTGAVLVFAVERERAYQSEHLEFLGNIASQIAHGFAKNVLTEHLVVSAVTGLAKLAENRDPETGDHLQRMAAYSGLIAEELGRAGPYRDQISGELVRQVVTFAPMHDIGKVGIADTILLKDGPLDEAERREMQRHPLIGGDVLRSAESQLDEVGHSVFRVAIDIAECHHERFDGGGYPRGLAGEAIPLAARIVAVADVFDALTSRRPYKPAWPVEKALTLLEDEAGKHFDPEVVAAFRRCLPSAMEIYERLKHV